MPSQQLKVVSQNDLDRLQRSISDHMTPRISKIVSDELKTEFRGLFREFTDSQNERMGALIKTVQRHDSILDNFEGKVRHVVKDEIGKANMQVPDQLIADIENTKAEMKKQGDELRRQRAELEAQNKVIKEQEAKIKTQQSLLNDLDIRNYMEELEGHRKVLKAHKTAIESHDSRMNDQQAQINEHDDRIEKAEINDRMGVLIIIGVKITAPNKIRESVIATIKKYLDINLTYEDFTKCYRLQDIDDKGTTQIMIRLKDPNKKANILMKRGKPKQSPIYLKEFLTKKQRSIMYQAREATKNGLLDNAWSWEGLVWGTAGGENKRGLISDYDYLKEKNEEEAAKPPNERRGRGGRGQRGRGTSNVTQQVQQVGVENAAQGNRGGRGRGRGRGGVHIENTKGQLNAAAMGGGVGGMQAGGGAPPDEEGARPQNAEHAQQSAAPGRGRDRHRGKMSNPIFGKATPRPGDKYKKPSHHDESFRPGTGRNNGSGSGPPNSASDFFDQYTKKPAKQGHTGIAAEEPIELSNQFGALQQMETE